jgi:hypothetical protein
VLKDSIATLRPDVHKSTPAEECVRSKGWSVPAHALICYKTRGLAAAPGAGPGRRRDSNTRYKDDDAVEMGDELRWISLASSGDPIIHMWIKAKSTRIAELEAHRRQTGENKGIRGFNRRAHFTRQETHFTRHETHFSR